MLLSLSAYVGKGQQLSYSKIQPPSCATCCDGSFIVQPLFSPANSLCNASPSLSFTNNYTSTVFYNACLQTYTITCWGSGENGQATESFTMWETTGLMSIKEYDDPGLFPNPTTGTLFTTLGDNTKVVIQSTEGQILFSGVIHEKRIDMNSLKPGLYLISVYSDDQVLRSRKRIVKN